MIHFFTRGKRIKPKDKHLVLNTSLSILFPLFLTIVLLFHGRELAQIEWKTLPETLQRGNLPPYLSSLLFSVGIALFFCLLVTLLFIYFQRDRVKQLYHRQKLARMLLENKWYESEQVKKETLFDKSSQKTKEKITHFPKLYYKLKDGLIHIRVEIILGKYQDQLLHLEKKLESGLYCELVEKELKDSYLVTAFLKGNGLAPWEQQEPLQECI